MGRKTIKVEELKDIVNKILLNTADNYIEGRMGVAVLLEDILHDTGNYKRYNNLSKQDMKKVQWVLATE